MSIISLVGLYERVFGMCAAFTIFDQTELCGMCLSICPYVQLCVLGQILWN